MDPTACFESIIYHWRKCMFDHHDVYHHDACIEHCDALIQWLESGGFPVQALDARDTLGFARIVRRLAQSQLKRLEG